MTTGQPIDTHIHFEKEPELNKFFKAVIKAGSSDLHLKVGQPPRMRISSRLKSTNAEIMTEKRMEELVFEILTKSQKQFFIEHGALDFAHEVEGDDRFRVNIFRQKGMVSLAARRITSDIPPFEKLHLPPAVEQISTQAHQGLILVTGPTGSGKSTTIASMIDYINRHRACHIVTIEDPIEYLHKDRKAIVSQREVGIDVPDFPTALRSLLRQDPDVVLVGEMRDLETIKAAMTAAETGHLVFGTLHAPNASQTVQRLLNMFPEDEQELARHTFGMSMRAIVSQQLLPSLKEGVSRMPAIEILISNSIVRKLIFEERETELPQVIRSNEADGMQDFTKSLCDLVDREWIDLKSALEYAPNVEELKMALKGIRSTAGGIL